MMQAQHKKLLSPSFGHRCPVMLMLLLLATLASLAIGQGPRPSATRVRVKELPAHLGETVIVKGRCGQIMEQYESGGLRAFSLRDDYGDMVVVLTTQNYPIMGTTVHVTGTPERRGGVLFLRGTYERWPRISASELKNYLGDLVQLRGKVVQTRKQGNTAIVTIEDESGRALIRWSEAPKKESVIVAYGKVNPTPQGQPVLSAESVQVAVPPPGVDPKLLGGLAVAVLALFGAGFVWTRRRLQEAQEAAESAALPAPWGIAEVIAGPDQGKTFRLRYEEVPLGREADPLTDVALTDSRVSRHHGRIIFRNGQILYEDVGSSFGSFVNEREVPRGQQMPLPENATLRLGPKTILRVRCIASPTETVLAGEPGVDTGPTLGDERPTLGDDRPTRRASAGNVNSGPPAGDDRPTED